MRYRIAAALGVLALAALTACSAPADDQPETPAQNSPATQPAEEQPDAEAFTAALAEIDPALAADPEEALKSARNVCTYVAAGEDEAQQLKAVTDRFEVSEKDAPAVLTAIKEHVC